MARLIRPYIPLRIRCQVAARQALAADITMPLFGSLAVNGSALTLVLPSYAQQLKLLLHALFGDAPVHLDHNPPLMLRMKIYNNNGKFVRYTPDANNPDHLIYRTAEDHKIKTLVRGDGAQRSDVSQRRYLKRVARNRKPKQKHKWPSRKFSKRVKS